MLSMSKIEEFLPAIRTAVREVINEEVLPRLCNLEKQISDIADMKAKLDSQQTRLSEHEDTLAFLDKQIQDIQTKSITELEKKFTELTEKVCFNILNLDLHRRKWSLIVNGVEGLAGEKESVTRDKVKCFARDKLAIVGAYSHPLAACHRLSQKNNAGIIVTFVDLNNRNEWLSNAKNLRNKDSSVSISPDMPPVLRPLKNDILKIRKDLPPDTRKNAQVKYLPTWPYTCLAIRGQTTRNPRITKKDIIEKYLT